MKKFFFVQLKFLFYHSKISRVETSDGSKREEVGSFRYVGGLAVKGSYEFVDDDGTVHKVNYVADEKGYRAEVV